MAQSGAGGGNGAVDGAAAALFAAGIAARPTGKVLWCITRPDLFAPALAQAGLGPDRVIYVEVGDDKTVLACMEGGLRHGGLGAAVAEVARLSMTASRRLQLCSEGTGSIGIALRRWRRHTEAADFGATDRCDDPLADFGLIVAAAARSRCRSTSLAGGTDPRTCGCDIAVSKFAETISLTVHQLNERAIQRYRDAVARLRSAVVESRARLYVFCKYLITCLALLLRGSYKILQ